ncbi:MAG TPA: hypothetical protein VG165_02370 [Solirubrobacteraceae bacterium]|jgi:hypothetical protein|nr:hypothetical protein [Solirubrobacteraceae bacterium]
MADRAVGSASLSAACKAVLTVPQAVYALARASHALFTLLSRSATDGPQGNATAQHYDDEVTIVERDLPTHRDLLRRFRSGCA